MPRENTSDSERAAQLRYLSLLFNNKELGERASAYKTYKSLLIEGTPNNPVLQRRLLKEIRSFPDISIERIVLTLMYVNRFGLSAPDTPEHLDGEK